MKIIQIAPFYLPVVGGMERIVRVLSEGLAERGHGVTVLTHNINRQGEKGVFLPFERINGVEVRRVIPLFKIHYGCYSSGIRKILSEEDVDVVHVHGYRHPHMEQACRVENGTESRVLLHGHSPFYPREVIPLSAWLWYKAYDKIAKHTVFRMADHLIALTPYEKKELVKRGCSAEKISVIQNPVPNQNKIEERVENYGREKVEKFRDNQNLNGYPLILYLGRIALSKKVDLIVKALPKIVEQEKNATLVIAGKDEGMAGNILQLADEIGVRDRIKYFGFVSDEEKSLLYLSSDVYTLASPYEGYGLTLLEAQAYGTPVVAYAGGGQKYAVSKGITIKNLNSSTLAAAVLKALNLEKSFDMEKYSVGKYIDRIEKLYREEVLKKNVR